MSATVLILALLAVSLAGNGLLLLRARVYRARYKEFRALSYALAGHVEAAGPPLLRLGELMPEVGNDRVPAAQAVDLVVPYAGWGEYWGFSDKENTTLAVLSRHFSQCLLIGAEAATAARLLAANASGLSVATEASSLDHSAPALVVMDLRLPQNAVAACSTALLRQLAPASLVLWHGYRPGVQTAAGIEAVQALAAQWPVSHLHGTSFIAYRLPEAA